MKKTSLTAFQKTVSRRLLIDLFFFAGIVQFFIFSNFQVSAVPTAAVKTAAKTAAPHAVQKQNSNGDVKKIDLSVPYARCRNLNSTGSVEDNASDNTLKYIYQNKSEFFTLTADAKLELLDATATGRIWTSGLGGKSASNAAFGDESVFVALKKSEGYFLKSVGRNTGVTVWQSILNLKLPADGTAEIAEMTLGLYGNKLILSSPDDGAGFYAFSPASGGLIWHRQLSGKITAFAVVDDKIFAADSENRIVTLAIETGEILRQSEKASKRITALESNNSGVVFTGDETGAAAALDSIKNIVLWKGRIGGAQISDVTLTRNGLLISSFDNYLYMLATDTGKRIWKKRLGGRITYKPTVAGGYAVVSSLFDASASIVDLKNGKIVNRIDLEAENFFNGGVLFGDKQIFASTAKGIVVFAASGKC